jgi:hypothetical protein
VKVHRMNRTTHAASPASVTSCVGKCGST